MALAWRADGGATDSNSVTQIVVADPGNAGDELVAILCVDNGAAAFSAPGGWVLRFTTAMTVDGGSVGLLTNASGTGSGNYTFTWTGSGSVAAIIAAFSGGGSFGNMTENNVDTGTADPWTITAKSVISIRDNAMLVWCAGIDPADGGGGDTFTAPSGFTNLEQASIVFNGCAIASAIKATAGPSADVGGRCTRGGAANAAKVGYLVVIEPPGPTITTQPTTQSACAGQTATFTISATASAGTLHYQWKDDGSNVGTDSSSYTTGTLTTSDDNSTITCVVTDDNSSFTSDPAKLFVRVCPSLAWNNKA